MNSEVLDSIFKLFGTFLVMTIGFIIVLVIIIKEDKEENGEINYKKVALAIVGYVLFICTLFFLDWILDIF